MKYDAVIVGGGEGGLFSGAILAKKGIKVLILEQAPQIGGRARSLEYKPGYFLDYGIHAIRYGKKGIIPTIFKKDLNDPLKLLHFKEGKLYRNEKLMDVSLSGELLQSSLIANEDKSTLGQVINDMIKLKYEDYFDVSIKDHWKYTIKNENIWNLISLMAAGIMVTPDIENASFGEFLYAIQMLLKSGRSASYPEGGWKTILNKLDNIISEHGDIRLKTKVKHIKIKNKAVQGVELVSGEFIDAENVIAAIPSQHLFSILDEKEFSKKFVQKAKNLICSSGISIDLGLKKKISDIDGLIAGDYPLFLACFMSNLDPHCAPVGEQLFTILQPVTKEVAKSKTSSDAVVSNLLIHLYKMFPEIKDQIKWKRILKILMMDGAICIVGQTRKDRPSVKSSIDGLYFSGDCYNGPGVGGDIAPSSARLCAKTILKEIYGEKIAISK
ncbi:MAG: phytoene desaturase family protein [Candidatus Hodarchaeota archaeon]